MKYIKKFDIQNLYLFCVQMQNSFELSTICCIRCYEKITWMESFSQTLHKNETLLQNLLRESVKIEIEDDSDNSESKEDDDEVAAASATAGVPVKVCHVIQSFSCSNQ